MKILLELFKEYYTWYFGIGFVFAVIHYYSLQKKVALKRKWDTSYHVTNRGYLFTLMRIPFYPIFILDKIIKFIAKV